MTDTKMIYLIKRRPTTSREELVAHWFANHMPAVIAGQHDAAARGKRHASRYYVTLFDADRDGEHPWDGMAQLWWDRPPRPPAEPLATTPTDTFQQKVLPHVPWATTEHVILDGSEHLPVEPLTLNAPFPCTRSGFYQLSFLVKAKDGHRLRRLLRALARRARAQRQGDDGASGRLPLRREPQPRSARRAATPGWRSSTSTTPPAGRDTAS